MTSLNKSLFSIVWVFGLLAGSATVRAEFIRGTVAAIASNDEIDGTEDSHTASGLTPSVNAVYDFSEGHFSAHSRAAARITVGHGVSIHVSSEANQSGDFDVLGVRSSADAAWFERFGASPSFDPDPDFEIPPVIRGYATLEIHGSIVKTGTAESQISVNVLANGSDTIYSSLNTASFSTSVELEFAAARIPLPVPYYVGRLSLSVHAFSHARFIGDNSHVDFSNTVTLKNVWFSDSEGNPLDATFTTDTGVNYNGLQAVPEPDSLALLLTGGAGGIGFFWRRRRS